jgi:hypothetical protein
VDTTDGTPTPAPANAQKQRGTPWPKGVSGNPAGRPKGVASISAAFNRILTREQAERIAQRIVDMAEAGDLKAADMVLDRMEGKPLQRVHQATETVAEALARELAGDDTTTQDEAAEINAGDS